MASHLENLIRDSLQNNESPADIWHKLSLHLDDENCRAKDAVVAFNFALNAGLTRSALKTLLHWLENKRAIPWGHFIAFIDSTGQTPSKAVLASLFKGARRQEANKELILAHHWDHYDKRFSKLRAEVVEELQRKYASKKEALKEKLTFLRNQRMIDEEKKLLDRLAQVLPQDAAIRKAKEEFKERWAREIIAKSHSSTRLEDEKRTRRETTYTEDELLFADLLRDEMMQLAQGSEGTYNFSIGLYFMELYSHALAVLKSGPMTPPMEWLYVELLLLNRRFIDGLEQLNQLEVKYIDDPETAFAASYLRAKAFWGLGRQAAAIDLLKSIVNVRPNYRSAHSLLSEWTERNL